MEAWDGLLRHPPGDRGRRPRRPERPRVWPALRPAAIFRAMTGFTTREVAEALGLTPRQVRTFARSGLLEPARGPGGAYRFTFHDVILLRTARELGDRDVPPRRIRRALARLRVQLPEGRPLSAVRVTVEGDRVVVRDRDTVWEPESGQLALDFAVEELATRVAPFAARAAEERAEAGEMDADGWYDLGVDLEAVAADQAARAYRRAIRLDPGHAEAHLNLGRLLHETGDLPAAEGHYRQALAARPGSALAAFNLGVVLEDRAETAEARELYERAVEHDPSLAPALFNLARICEAEGDMAAALRHLSAYKRLRGAG